MNTRSSMSSRMNLKNSTRRRDEAVGLQGSVGVVWRCAVGVGTPLLTYRVSAMVAPGGR